MRQRLRGLAVSLALAGCADPHQTEVRLRNVHDVAVLADQETGTATLLPSGADGHDVPVPQLALAPSVDAASVSRNGAGAIELRCPACSPPRRVVGTLLRFGEDPSEVLTWSDTSLRIRYAYRSSHEGYRAPRDAFWLTFETPRDNVVDARRKVTVDRDGTAFGFGLGAVATAMGLGMGVLAVLLGTHVVHAEAAGEMTAASALFGAAFLAFGGTVLGISIHTSKTRDVDESVVP